MAYSATLPLQSTPSISTWLKGLKFPFPTDCDRGMMNNCSSAAIASARRNGPPIPVIGVRIAQGASSRSKHPGIHSTAALSSTAGY